jgi:hypothetical protein
MQLHTLIFKFMRLLSLSGCFGSPLLTLGATTSDVEGMLKDFPTGWSAVDVVNRLKSGLPAGVNA